MKVRAKPHRLPLDQYVGQVEVAFTLRLKTAKPFFTTSAVVDPVLEELRKSCSQHGVNTIFTFMPEHAHLIAIGIREDSDVLKWLDKFKQLSGWWLKINRPDVQWHRSSYDHRCRSTHDFADQVRYVLDNPVRRGLVQDWREYPFTGAIGIDLEEFLLDLMPF